jgi:hypothetical protein
MNYLSFSFEISFEFRKKPHHIVTASKWCVMGVPGFVENILQDRGVGPDSATGQNNSKKNNLTYFQAPSLPRTVLSSFDLV